MVSLAKLSLGAVLLLCGLSQVASAEPAAAGRPLGKMRLGYLAGVPLIPREKLFGNPEKASPRLSPDGRRLAYLAPDEGVLNVWVGPVDKPAAARPVTHDRKRGIRTFFWTYTNQQILYLQDSGGNENFHVYRVDLDTTKDPDRQGHVARPPNVEAAKESGIGAKTTDLTPLENVRAEIIEVSHRIPGAILVGLNDRDAEVHDVYRLDLASGRRELVQKNTEHFAEWVTDLDFHVRFGSKLTEDGDTLLMQPDGKGGWKTFLTISSDDALTTSPMGFDKSGTTLYMLDSRGRNTGALAALDLATGQEKILAQNPLCDVGGVLMTPLDQRIEAVSFDYERTSWEVLDAAVADDFRYLHTVAHGDLQIVSQTLDNQHWIVAYLMDDGPIRYYRYDRAEKTAHFLFTNRKDLEKLPLVRMHPVVIKARDGLNLVSYLSLPPGTAAGDSKSRYAIAAASVAEFTYQRNVAANNRAPGSVPLAEIQRLKREWDNAKKEAEKCAGDSIHPNEPVPLVLDVHGGPWARDSWGFQPEHQLWANRGYAVLSVNYRGSMGFGKEFVNAGNRQWAGKMHDDLVDAVRWAIAEKIADPHRVAISGGSYGGYATLVGLTVTPDLFACGVDIVGPSNILTLLKTIPPYWKPAIQMFKIRVGDYSSEAGRKFLEERSPLTHVDQIQRPLLIGQGANDPRVKQAESDQIVKAMQHKHIPVTYVLFPDEGHGFVRPANRLAFYAVTEAFLAKFLGGRYQPIGTAFQGSTITVPTGARQVPGLGAVLPDKKP
jgi:dipeptidyl aminopeptidase/acylaminoacyl peptidase